jgi:hypothetical protein
MEVAFLKCENKNGKSGGALLLISITETACFASLAGAKTDIK